MVVQRCGAAAVKNAHRGDRRGIVPRICVQQRKVRAGGYAVGHKFDDIQPAFGRDFTDLRQRRVNVVHDVKTVDAADRGVTVVDRRIRNSVLYAAVVALRAEAVLVAEDPRAAVNEQHKGRVAGNAGGQVEIEALPRRVRAVPHVQKHLGRKRFARAAAETVFTLRGRAVRVNKGEPGVAQRLRSRVDPVLQGVAAVQNGVRVRERGGEQRPGFRRPAALAQRVGFADRPAQLCRIHADHRDRAGGGTGILKDRVIAHFINNVDPRGDRDGLRFARGGNRADQRSRFGLRILHVIFQ